MEEHRILLDYTDKLISLTNSLRSYDSFESCENIMTEIKDIVKHFKESEKHYLREENVLFPYIEKHGITEPPAIMWMDHDKIRAIKKIYMSF